MDVIHLQRQLLRKPPEYNAATCDRVQSWQLPELSKRDLEATSMTGSNIDGTSIRHRRNVSSRETSRYNLGFGVLSISRSKSKHTNPRQEVRWVEAQITELSFQPSTLHYFQRCFSVLCERSLGAWQYSLRTFSIFTTDDCIYYCCASGDLDRAKQLCREGRASPSSVTNNGFTLLHVSLLKRN